MSLGFVKPTWKKGTGGGIRTGRVGWDLPELFCKSPPSYTWFCLEAFPGSQIHFSFDLAFKCSESGNVSCPMKAHLLNILRIQTEHFHGRSERILSVTPGTDVKFVLGWTIPLPWESTQGLTLLRNPLCSAECWCCLGCYSQIPVSLWCSTLNNVAVFDLQSRLRTVAKDTESVLTLAFEVSLFADWVKLPSNPLCKCTPREIPAIECDQPVLLHWWLAPPSPHPGTRTWRTLELCYSHRQTFEGCCVAKRESELLCCLWFLWVRKTLRNRSHLKKAR